MECKIKNDNGTIFISEDVMMKVVGYAALECYGIVAMSGKRATDGIVEALEFPEHPFYLGVQWHPERMKTTPALFRAHVEAARAYRAS